MGADKQNEKKPKDPVWAVNELPARKTGAALLWPCALRVSTPFRLNVELK